MGEAFEKEKEDLIFTFLAFFLHGTIFHQLAIRHIVKSLRSGTLRSAWFFLLAVLRHNILSRLNLICGFFNLTYLYQYAHHLAKRLVRSSGGYERGWTANQDT